MKKILMSLLVIALMLGVIGAASTAGMSFSGVGALSLGVEPIPEIDVDYIGFHLSSGHS